MTGKRSSAFNRMSNRMFAGIAARALAKRIDFTQHDTALLLVDCQQDFLCRPNPLEGIVESSARELSLSKLEQLVDLARRSPMPIFYSRSTNCGNAVRFPTPSQQAISSAGLLARGTSGMEIAERLSPAEGDTVLKPRTAISAFVGTGLMQSLQSRNISRLIVAGLRTDVEVDSTARDAAEHGFQTIVVSDACVGTTLANHEATLEMTLPRLVHAVLDVAAISSTA